MPEQQDNAEELAGFLYKSGERISLNYKLRWVVLETTKLSWYLIDATESGVQLSGELKLSNIENIKLLPKGRSFKIHTTPGTKMCFRAFDQAQSRQWFLALLQHIQSNKGSSDEMRLCDNQAARFSSPVYNSESDEDGIELSNRSKSRIASNLSCKSWKSVRIVSDLSDGYLEGDEWTGADDERLPSVSSKSAKRVADLDALVDWSDSYELGWEEESVGI